MALLHQFWPEPASLYISVAQHVSYNTEILEESPWKEQFIPTVWI